MRLLGSVCSTRGRGRGCRSRGFAFCAVLTLCAASARAEPKKFALNWVREEGAESCIASHALALAIVSTFGPVFALADDAELAIEGSVAPRREGGYAARIAISDRRGVLQGVRTLTSRAANCRALDPQLMLVIALSIDPEIAFERSPNALLEAMRLTTDPGADLLTELKAAKQAAHAARAEPEPMDAPPPAHAAALPPAAAAPVVNTESEHVSLELGVALGLGVLPTPSVGPALDAQLGIADRWALTALLVYWPRSGAALAEPTARGDAVIFSMLLAVAAPCVEIARMRILRWAGCAGLGLGLRWFDASALTHPTPAKHPSLGAELSTGLTLRPWAPLVVGLGAGLSAPFRAERFTYAESSASTRRLWSPAAVGLRGTLSAGLEF